MRKILAFFLAMFSRCVRTIRDDDVTMHQDNDKPDERKSPFDDSAVFILDWLTNLRSERSHHDDVTSEYRLFCASELFNSDVQTLEWEKSDVCRILSSSPFQLEATPYRLNDGLSRGAELRLVIRTPLVTQKTGLARTIFHPDDEVADDVASILTIYCRRLITIGAKISQTYHAPSLGEVPLTVPLPTLRSSVAPNWPPKPATVVYGASGGVSGIEKIVNYNPLPKGISGDELKSLFQRLPKIKHARRLILAARLYSEALQLIHSRSDLSYILLVFCVETIATGVYETYIPSREKKDQVKGALRKALRLSSLSQAEIDTIIDTECKSILWTNEKCKKFLADHIAKADFEGPDDLFPGTKLPCGEPEDFQKALNQVFKARNEFIHAGQPYPRCITLGLSPRVDVRAFDEVFGAEPLVPPVAWFERVVNTAINNYIRGQILAGASNAQ